MYWFFTQCANQKFSTTHTPTQGEYTSETYCINGLGNILGFDEYGFYGICLYFLCWGG